MADLKQRDRGQLILIAAFALAVTFIALALVVNSAIFTENLASRGETGGSADAITLRHDVERGVGASIESANIYNTSDLDEGVNKGIGNVNTAYSKQSAAGTAIVNVSRKSGSTRDGSRIAQNASGGRNFSDSNGNSDWTVVEDVERAPDDKNATRAFVMNVTKSDLETSETGAFRIVVEKWQDSSTTWSMTLWRDSSTSDVINVNVNVDGLPDARCAEEVDDGFVHVDVTKGTVAGEPCGALRRNDTDSDGNFENYRFASGVGDQYNISYENSDEVHGNYSLVTTNTSIDSSNNLHDGVGSDSPYGDEAVYSVVVEYVYKSPQLDYETDVRVAPGEPRD